jgi:NADH:ubiquinone oxidoreductase subunit 6 (subunit J)
MESLITILLVITGAFIIVSTNPLYSIIGLIAIFLNAAALLFLHDLDFLAFIFIIIYVGAICVLFLFIIMLLNLRVVENTQVNLPTAMLLLAMLVTMVGGLVGNPKVSSYYTPIERETEYISSTDLYASVLYTSYAVYFVAIAVILLYAMIAAILLTHQIIDRKNAQRQYTKFF